MMSGFRRRRSCWGRGEWCLSLLRSYTNWLACVCRCVPVLEECSLAFTTIDDWLAGVRRGKFNFFSRGKQAVERAKKVENVVQVREALSAALKTFREQGR